MAQLSSKLTPKQIEILNRLNFEKQVATARLDDMIGFIASAHGIDVSQIERSEIINDEFVITTKENV